jgi:two-component system chemotaxis sensor kinase CheA
MDVAKYAELFLTESREHLSSINHSLLELESAPEGPEGADVRAGAVDALFRGAHTIKGMSATMGYTVVADLSHDFEAMLDRIRRGEERVTRARIDEMLKAADALESAVEDAVGGQRASAAPRERRVRIDLRRLDTLMNLIGELVITRGRLAQLASSLGDPALDEAVSQAWRLITDLQDEIMTSRMVPVWQVFDRFPRLVRDAARELGKEVMFEISGKDIELDRSMLDEIGDPIVHLLRNAVDHGIERPDVRTAAGKSAAGRLSLSAVRDRSAVLIRVSDDGRGIDRTRVLRKAQDTGLIERGATSLTDDELVRLISRAGFSTAESVTGISGRGVGIDAVQSRVRALGGSVEIVTAPGQGTTVTARLPLTLAITRAVLARVADETYAIPMSHVDQTVAVDAARLATVQGRPVLVLRDTVMPLVRLRDAVGLCDGGGAEQHLLVVESGGRHAAIAVDELTAQQEIVVKQFDGVRGGLPLFSGVTILGDGAPALIVDVSTLL